MNELPGDSEPGKWADALCRQKYSIPFHAHICCLILDVSATAKWEMATMYTHDANNSIKKIYISKSQRASNR